MKQKTDNVIASIGIASAVGASMCCIGPVLAFFAGASGLVAALSWFEPARPVLITVTIGFLIFAWYQKSKPGISCDCEAEKIAFVRSKLFLAVVTVFAAAILSFPYYAGVFYPNSNSKSPTITVSQYIRSTEFL